MISRAFVAASPVVSAYFSLGTVFGILARQAGFGAGAAIANSAIVYAGTVQFVALDILASGGGLWQILLPCSLLACRNAFYGLAFLRRYQRPLWAKLLLIHGIVDGSFAVLTGKDPSPDPEQDRIYVRWVNLFIYLSWVGGTAVGVTAASWVPEMKGTEFILTALFVTLGVDQIRRHGKTWPPLLAAVCGGVAIAITRELFLLLAVGLLTGPMIWGCRREVAARHADG